MPRRKKDETTILMEMERRVLTGLAAEWDLVQWRIPDVLRGRLHRPQFRIADMATTWGHWSAETNTITLSRRLIRHHPWDAVRDVLLHEVAHQISHEMSGGRPPTPHGKCFRDACDMIAANPRASGDYPLLDERAAGTSQSREDSIRLKIKKLLAMARSPNANEAATALVKARHLMARHRIDAIDDGGETDACISIFLGRPALRHTRDHTYLGGLLADFYFVSAIWVPAWALDREKVGNVLEISGRLGNVQMAGYVYDFIRRHIDRRWHAYAAHRKLNRHRRTDFAVGIIQGFRSQLEQDARTTHSEAGHALLRVDDPHLTAYVKRRYPKTRTVHTRVTQADAEVMADGRQEGRRLRITTPVQGNHRSGDAALPGQQCLRLPGGGRK